MTTTIELVTIFCHRLLVYSPMVFLLFSNRIKNTRAAGNRVTATTCTNRVINTSGALGISTTNPAVMSVMK